jgi:transcriptional regulator with XRE-family HTH domain
MASDFAHAFGGALQRFLESEGISQSGAAHMLGLEAGGRARINTYCRESSKGKRPKPSAEMLYLLCTRLGFAFEYNGYKISAATLNGKGKRTEKTADQLSLPFERQFNLTDQRGTVSVSIKRPPGHVEILLSLDAAS